MSRRSIRCGLLSIAIATFGLLAVQNALAQQSPATMAAVSESAPIPAEQIPQPIKDSVNSPDRSAADKSLDAGRQPDQMLAFFGIKPGMKVADLSAGGGYTTELLSRAVGPKGIVYSQNPVFPPQYEKIGQAWKERLKEPWLKNVVAVNKPFTDPDLLPVPPGTVDAAIMNMNYHDLVLLGVPRDTMNAAVFKALKPGGVYGIIDHSAKDGSGAKDVALHRIDEKFVIDEIKKAGFKLAAASSALRHPDDDRTWMVFKKRGETDRFMLKFVKP
jgi:predicted methyltransferase